MLKILQARLPQYVNRELPSSQSYGFSNSHVWMWQLDNKEIWAPKNWCFWTVVLEKTLESPLDCKEIQPVHPKGNQSWIFIGRTDILKLKLQYFGHLMWRTDSFEKTLMLGKIEGRRRRDDRGWDGWMASPTRWTWVWVNSGRYWRTGKPGMLQSMGSQSRAWLSDWITVKAEELWNLNITIWQPIEIIDLGNNYESMLKFASCKIDEEHHNAEIRLTACKHTNLSLQL